MDSDSKTGVIIAGSILLLGLLTFAGTTLWAYNRYTTTRDRAVTDQAQAVQQAKKEQKEELEAEFAQESEKPYRTYSAPSDKAGIVIEYPKSWSAEVTPNGSGNTEFFFRANPGEIDNSKGSLYAFNLALLDETYDKVLGDYDGQLEKGELKAEPYKLDSVEGSVGIKLTGNLSNKIKGVAVLFKVRDKTIIAHTQSTKYISDFMEIVDEHIKYNP